MLSLQEAEENLLIFLKMYFKICFVDILKPPRAEAPSLLMFFHPDLLKNYQFCCHYKIVNDAHRSKTQAWWTRGTGTLTGDTWMWSCGWTEVLLSCPSSLQAAAGSPGYFPLGISPETVAKAPASGSTRAPATVPDGKINVLVLLCDTVGADPPLWADYMSQSKHI